MIEKIIKVKGVGLLHDAVPTAIKFSKITVIFGENGRGKSTLCTIFSSLLNRDPSAIIARKTIAGNNNQEIHILIDNVNYRFANSQWDHAFDKLVIFNSEFVEKNLYSGFTISANQREALLEFTLGEMGISLKNEVDKLTDKITKTTSDIRESRLILARIGNPLSIEAYVALERDPDVDRKIDQSEKLVVSLKNIDEIVKKPPLTEILMSPPDFDKLRKLLLTTLSTISEDAKQKVIQHISAHLKVKDEQWIKRGLSLVKSEKCPFCGTKFDEAKQLLELYNQYFDESYQQYQIKLQAFQRLIQDEISDASLAKIQYVIELNKSHFESNWKEIIPIPLDDSEVTEIKQILSKMRDICQRLITSKIADPLSTITIEPDFDICLGQVNAIPKNVEKYNNNIRTINESIKKHKETLKTTDLAIAQTNLFNWKMRKSRYESPNLEICEKYLEQLTMKKIDEDLKERARERFVQYTNDLLGDIEHGINNYLTQLNAGFRIVNFDTSHERGTPRLKYQIQLRNQNFELGSPDNPQTRPSFSNTLSEGDKLTLAFAFFLTRTNLDPHLSDNIIIVDDPMSSLDQSRQFTTQIALKSLASRGKQLIVLSHDPRFLQAFLENGFFSQTESAILEIKRTSDDYSIITSCDLEECVQSAYKNNYRTVSEYVYQGQCHDKFYVVRAIRPLVEATLRYRYLDSLKGADALGKMIDMIEQSPTTSPLNRAKNILPQLKALNVYSSGHTHDTSANDTVQQISDIELKNYAQFALEFAQGS